MQDYILTMGIRASSEDTETHLIHVEFITLSGESRADINTKASLELYKYSVRWAHLIEKEPPPALRYHLVRLWRDRRHVGTLQTPLIYCYKEYHHEDHS